MKAEDKELLVRAICGYLPYGLEVNYDNEICGCVGYAHGKVILVKKFSSVSFGVEVELVKPYLRPMSSMTEAEEEERIYFNFLSWKGKMEFCQEKHLDYYDLIEKGIGIEMPKDMY